MTAPTIVTPLTTPAPVAGVYYLGTGATFTVAGTVTDEVSIVSKVELKVDNVLEATMIDVGSGLGAGTTSRTWTKTLTIASLINVGSRNYSDKAIDVIAYDAQNNASTKTFTLKGDKVAPSVVSTTPAEGGSIGDNATFDLSVRASDDTEIDKITITFDGVGTTWDSSNGAHLFTLEPGSTTIDKTWTRTFDIAGELGGYSNKGVTITAFDKYNNSIVTRRNFTGDIAKPDTITITNANNSALPASFNLEGTFGDNIAVTRILIELDGGSTWDTADALQDGITFTTAKTGNWSKALTVAGDLGNTYTDKMFTVTAFDAQGNSRPATVTLIGDRRAPVIADLLPASGSFQKTSGGSFTLSGTVSDKRQDNVTNGVVSSVSITYSGTTKSATSFDGTNWSISSTEFTVVEGNASFDVVATDNLGNSSTERIFVIVDNSVPAVGYISPSAGSVLNGVTPISGTVSDGSSGVKSIYIAYLTSVPTLTNYDTEAELEAKASTVIGDITDGGAKHLFKIASPTASWSHDFDTTKLYDQYNAVENAAVIYVFAVDMMGNVRTTGNTLSIKIDQREDIPTGQIFSPAAAVVSPQTVVSGMVSDDDGVAKIYWYIGDATVTPPVNVTTWAAENAINTKTKAGTIDLTATNPRDASFTLTSPNEIGNFKTWIVVEDIDGKRSYFPDADFSAAYDNNLIKTFTQEVSTTPTVTNLTAPVATLSGIENVSISVLGGTTDTSLELDITSIKYTIVSSFKNSGELSVVVAPGSKTWTGDVTFDTTEYTDVNDYYDITVTIWATNSQGNTSQNSVVIYKADNKGPTVQITGPVNGEIINGNQIIFGTANDWAQVDALYFGYFTTASEPDMVAAYDTKAEFEANLVADVSAAATPINKWFKVANPSLNWNYTFNTTKVYDDLAGHTNYKLFVAAVDMVGNVSYDFETYTIDQDKDKPIVTITNPSLNGITDPVAEYTSIVKIPKTYVMMGTVKDGDGEGVRNVEIDIDLMNPDGSKNSDIYPLNTIGDSGDGYNNVSSSEPMILGDQVTNWTYQMEDYIINGAGGFYKVTVRPVDYGTPPVKGLIATSYFVVSNEAPELTIISPSIYDPDGSPATNVDMYGTVISNVKDDIYWDNDNSNNLIYHDDDSNRRNWGWNNDLSEAIFNIFGSNAVDSTRSNYYRMIFRAKDNGRLNNIEVSVDGGQNAAAEITWSGGKASAIGTFSSVLNSAAIVKVGVMNDGATAAYTNFTYNDMSTATDIQTDWVYFFVDIDTTQLSSSTILRITAADNNEPSSYETTASVGINVDNSTPSGNIKNWGIDSLDENYDFGKTSNHQFIGGDLADVGSAGVRYVNLYFWNNQASSPDDTPDYNEDGAGLLIVNDLANVPSGTHKITMPEDLGSVTSSSGDVLPANTNNNLPNYWIRTHKYLSSGWRIQEIYTNNANPTDADGQPGTYYGVSTKYGSTEPTDGKKLICLEIVDNAGNKLRKFYEHTFSEYPPSHENTYLSWAAMNHAADKQTVTDETTAGRKWISGDLVMSGTVRDFTAVTNPSPGIERVRVYVKSENGTTTHAIYTSKTADTVADAAHNNVVPAKVINTIADISVSPTATDTSVAWEFASGQATTGRTDGNYLIEVEVRDKTGVTSVKKQYVYIDNTAPSLTVTQPTAAQVVKGDLFTFTGTVVTTGETFEGNCISISVTYPGGSNSWTTGVTGSAWSKAWDLGAETEFTQGESATVSISVTDKAGNTTTNPDITISKGAPPTWTNFTANASSTAFTNAAFIANYSSVITVNEVYMIKGATSTFVAEIDDGVTFTDADLVITGLKQSDGTTHSETTRSMTINTTEVTDSFGYSSIPDGEYTYKAELKQGTAEINMKKYFIVDNTKPNIWVKKIENTDYVLDGATKLGHIDAEHGDWGTGYTTTADAISGVVKTRVKVKDNYLLKNVSVSLENYNFGNGDGTAKVLLERDITGAWGTAASRGVVGDLNYFAVKDVAISLGADSDYVSFTLEFNTANLTGVAGINKSLQFTATDWVGNLTDEAGTNAGIETATYDTYNSATVMGVGNAKPVAFVLDVVPYITRIDTQLGNATSVVDRKSVYNRTSTGRYPVYKDLTRGLYEVINVYGYNLVPDYIVVGKDADGINATNNGLEAGVNQLGGITTVVANSQYSVSVENAVQSGYINVVNATGWISTTNNVKSVYSTENEEKNNMNNNLLKDNRWLELWTFNQVAGVTEARMVDMELSTNNNINWGMGYTDNRAGVSVNNAAPVELRRSYTRYFDNKIAFNTSNSYFFVSQCGDTLGVPVTAWTSGPSQFGLNYRNTPGASWEYNSAAAGGRKVYIESNWNGADVNKLDRVQNPDMKISGDDAYSRVYMTYYDSLQKLVKFRFFEIGTDAAITTGGTVNVDYVTLDTTGTIRSTLVPYRNGGVQWNQTEQGVVGAHRNGGTKRQGFVAIAGANGNSNTAAVGYTADNTAIVAWYDSVGTSLKIKYNTSPWSSYSGYFEFDSNNLAVPVANTYRFKLSVDGTLVNSGNDIAVTFTAPTGGTNRHQLVYELNKILTENYGCFAEVNPVTNRLIFRSFQTGATSRVVLSAPTGANSLLTAMGAFNQAAGAGVAWVERSIDTDGAGKFVSITTDGGAKGGIHLAYQQTANGDLKYAYLPTYDCADGAIRVVTVDSYGQVGQYTDINIKDVSGAKIPYITYYNMSNADTKLGAKVAYPITAPSTWTDNTVAGVNSSELFTGNWEVSIIPAREVPKQYRISNGITTAGDLIVGYQGDLVEYGTYLP
ncbi:MAG TPA: hypothetical protein DDY71_09305 [Spirochaetia bacterium]|nr:hypothetical protein [Spirochaetia bacterium]